MPKSKAETHKNVMAILMGDEENPTESIKDAVVFLDIDDLADYANHPFKLYEGERLKDMVRSISEFGVLVPSIVRPNPNSDDKRKHEILSGHNRKNGAKLAGETKLPCIIREGLTDDEAKLIVTETNLVQRSFTDLSHSERAIALRAHLEAIKSQGKRSDLLKEIEMLSNPHETKKNSVGGLIDHRTKSRDVTAEKYGVDARSVSRYVRLCELNKSLLKRVDDDEIGLYPAVSLSYLSPDEQTELERLLDESAYKVDMKKAEALREYSEGKKMTPEKMQQILSGELNRKPKPKTAPPFKLKAKIYQKYFDPNTPQGDMEAIIDQALAEYYENRKKEAIE